ncbi:hypothetical protein G6F59_017076 [Rhizopus arrhizus]|nr:hypothetical protein G6F59_017076 [Rhizopus arrhizus]
MPSPGAVQGRGPTAWRGAVLQCARGLADGVDRRRSAGWLHLPEESADERFRPAVRPVLRAAGSAFGPGLPLCRSDRLPAAGR